MNKFSAGTSCFLLCLDRHCWVDTAAVEAGQAPQAFCPADEHYLPTLLASLGREAETDCTVRSPRRTCHVGLWPLPSHSSHCSLPARWLSWKRQKHSS